MLRTFEKGGATGKDNVAVQRPPEVNVGFPHRVVDDGVYAGRLVPNDRWVKEHLGRLEALRPKLQRGQRGALQVYRV